MDILNGENIYIQVTKELHIFKLPKSYIYSSYHRGHISSTYLSTTNIALHGKTNIAHKGICPYERGIALSSKIFGWKSHTNIII